jgi:hypothetical protein
MTKFIVQFRPRPIDPAPVLAPGGKTSLNTAQVTGPNPVEKALTNPKTPITESGWIERLIPSARRSAKNDMRAAEIRRIRFEPSL